MASRIRPNVELPLATTPRLQAGIDSVEAWRAIRRQSGKSGCTHALPPEESVTVART